MQQAIAERGIKVEKHLPTHGTLQTAKEAADTVCRKDRQTSGLRSTRRPVFNTNGRHSCIGICLC